jgi:hypothetical protein
VAHEKAVTGVGHRRRIVVGRTAAVNLAQDGNAAAVVDVVEQSRGLRGHGSQHDELAAKGDPSTSVARGVFQVSDSSIDRRFRVECEMGYSTDLFIRANLSKRHS